LGQIFGRTGCGILGGGGLISCNRTTSECAVGATKMFRTTAAANLVRLVLVIGTPPARLGGKSRPNSPAILL